MARQTSKQELRTAMRELRASLPRPYRQAAALRAVRHAARLLRNRRTVAVYLANGSEMATAPLILELLSRGHHLCAPRLAGRGMVFARLTRRTHLRGNRYGILEPLNAPRATHIDAVVLPLLAFDAGGGRLGQGGGHYDRFFARLRPFRRPLRVGYGFAFQELSQVPAQSHDVRVHVIVTERGVQWATG